MKPETGKPWVVIPTCGASPHLVPLLETITHDARVCVVINNIIDDREQLRLMADYVAAGAEVEIINHQVTIYQVWNWAIEQARRIGVSTLALLNDDIMVGHWSVDQIDHALSSDPDLVVLGWDHAHPKHRQPERVRRVAGSYRKGGIGGFAFAVKPDRVPLVDEGFQWWGGDDDLMFGAAQMGGALGVLVGCGVEHWTSTSAAARPWVYDNVEADRSLLLSRWGDTW